MHPLWAEVEGDQVIRLIRLLALMTILWALFLALIYAEDSFLGTARAAEQLSPDPRHIAFIEICFGGGGGCALVSGDRDLPIIRFLLSHQKERIALSIEPGGRIER